MLFKNRQEAGQLLADYLEKVLNIENPQSWIILFIPRWGIEIALEVSKKLWIKFAPLVVKKLAPLHMPEYWFWAVDPDGYIIYDRNYMYALGVDDDMLWLIHQKTLEEVKQRVKKYSFGKLPDVNWKNVIIVDDWVATWYTAAVAASWAKRHGANKVILASPVCPADIDLRLWKYFDEIYCLYKDPNLRAIWQYYLDFHQIEDDEYFSLLKSI